MGWGTMCTQTICTPLFTELRLRGFQACGTLRLDRRGTPTEAKERFPKGEEKRALKMENMSVVQWHDKRIVSILTTMHSEKPVEIERRSRSAPGGREVVEKPEAVVEYNKFMGGVAERDCFVLGS